jgi:hypothetical protein
MSFFSNNNVTADPSKVAKTYTPIPEGVYSLLVEKCEEKQSKNGDPMLSVKFKVEGGEYAGRFLFETIMLAHEKPGVVEMGQRKLHGLMLLTGIKAPKDASDFVGQVATTRVKVGIDKGTGEPRNEVTFSIPAEAKVETAPVAPPKPEAKGKKGGDW